MPPVVPLPPVVALAPPAPPAPLPPVVPIDPPAPLPPAVALAPPAPLPPVVPIDPPAPLELTLLPPTPLLLPPLPVLDPPPFPPLPPPLPPLLVVSFPPPPALPVVPAPPLPPPLAVVVDVLVAVVRSPVDEGPPLPVVPQATGKDEAAKTAASSAVRRRVRMVIDEDRPAAEPAQRAGSCAPDPLEFGVGLCPRSAPFLRDERPDLLALFLRTAPRGPAPSGRIAFRRSTCGKALGRR